MSSFSRGSTKAPDRRRRRLLLLCGGCLAFGASRLLAQQSRTARRIALLLPGTEAGYRLRFDAFREELQKLGHVEGRDVSLELRWANDKMEQLAPLAAELVALRPAVILTASSAGVAACKKATATIPIVFATAGSPVEQGFVSSLRRPGGNVTGVVVHIMERKWVQLARDALPHARRLAYLVYEPDPIHKGLLDEFLSAATQFRFEPVVVRVREAEGLAHAFSEIVGHKPDALVLPNLTFLFSHRRYLVERSLEAKLPLLTGSEDMTVAGGLLSYGTPTEENYRRAAVLVDKILRGASPAELPVEQPERFRLVVNLRTANAIGVRPAQGTLLRADRIIE